ncbi:MAG TPA: TetR family transcriptional regulator [Actinomycetota bacterium]
MRARLRKRRLPLADQRAALGVEGLEGLSIGRLAEATGMPKSSVYVLFGSKEELQLATVDAAREAGQAGEMPAGTGPAQLAFELSAILAGTNIVAVLHDDDTAIDHARRAVTARLGA